MKTEEEKEKILYNKISTLEELKEAKEIKQGKV